MNRNEGNIYDYRLAEEAAVRITAEYENPASRAHCPRVEERTSQEIIDRFSEAGIALQRTTGYSFVSNDGLEFSLRNYEAPGSNGKGVMGISSSVRFDGTYRRSGITAVACDILGELYQN